jgi:RNA polymerase sigma-70 factor, ECF subfamily
LDDRSLVQGLLQGDSAAQSYFDRVYRVKLYRACCHLLGYKDGDAEDVVQDTFMAALQQLPKFEYRSSLYRWLYQIAMYKCFRVIRKRRKQVSTLHEEMEVLAAGEALDRSQSQEEEKKRQEMAQAIRAERDALGDPCRTLLKKRDEEGLTYGQLAEAFKIPVGTVMSRLARCMESLRARLARRQKGEAP